MAGQNTNLLVLTNADLETVLPAAARCAHAGLLPALDKAFASSTEPTSAEQAASTLATLLAPRLAIAVQKNEFGPVTAVTRSNKQVEAPVDDPGPWLVSVVLPLQPEEEARPGLVPFLDSIGLNAKLFQLAGYSDAENDLGYYLYQAEGTFVREFWSPRVPCTGLISTGVMPDSNLLVANHPNLPVQYAGLHGGKSATASLADSEHWKTRLDASPKSADLWIWYVPQAEDENSPAPAPRILTWTHGSEGARLTIRAED